MTPDQVMSRCYEHGQPDYVLAADTINAFLAAQPASPLRGALQKIADTDQYPDHEDTAAELREIARGALSASPPEQPSPHARESVRQIAHRHCTCTCRDDPKV